ncbi:fasciclin domain-containing protein [Alteromonas gilva]|uniref:Fasciclin domain-containing protein n=1 Tax=Alteromonas gilva TaxID=2987522 RepID=A0ABT5L213_9ALTE|nr:fasciclin domain-containing protein [Alteromonas gilva]MDC8831076.1 fasciclin domain-containing protein [Alteromonas gilva]
MKNLIKSIVMTVSIAAVSMTALANHHGEKKHDMKPSVVSIAVDNPDFSTLVTALKAADLVGALQGDGPFTVFAPTNDAFAKLPAGTLESLLKPENKAKLVEILTYHVVPGKVTAGQVVKLSTAETLQGGSIAISTSMGKVMVDNATVVATDIMGSNGVIHVIDSVILPK